VRSASSDQRVVVLVCYTVRLASGLAGMKKIDLLLLKLHFKMPWEVVVSCVQTALQDITNFFTGDIINSIPPHCLQDACVRLMD
jgi:hypothetical protein